MAITRAQIARQLLQFGGGADMGRDRGPETGREPGPVGGGKGIGGNGGNTNRERGIMRSIPQAITDVQRGTLSDPREKQDVFQRPSKLSFLDFIPGIGAARRIASVFGPLDNQKFFEDKVVPSLLDRGRKVPTFENYMKNRMAGAIDAYGNPIDQDDDNNIILPQTMFAQAPSITEQEPEEVEEPFQLSRRFRAEGGRIEAQEGGIMPRLNQLGSGVSSAEQTLQEINQRLESAESTLGGGGGNQMPAGFGTRPLLDAKIDPNFKPVEELKAVQPQQGVDNMGFNFRQEGDMGRYIADNDPGQLFAGFSSYQDYLNAGNDPVSRPQGPQPLPAQGVLGIPAASYADGGNVVGGEFDFESARQMYGLGKLVKKVTRSVKKIAKSPVGKAAILAAGGYYLGGGNLFGLQRSTPLGKFAFGQLPGAGLFAKSTPVKLAAGVPDRLAFNAARTAAGTSGGLFSSIPGGAVTAGIVGTSLLAGLMTPEQESEAQQLSDNTGIDIDAARRSILNAGTAQDFRARRFRAEGGSMKEPVAKKTMPLLDMGGQEMDLRAEGGFVPIGRMEKADDVPARLSKNEFVFTADAVRNAGEGDVDKGAEVMYNMMKNLEAGGEVSEESQGLQGARKMFQTSQRLEEVL